MVAIVAWMQHDNLAVAMIRSRTVRLPGRLLPSNNDWQTQLL